MFSPFLYFIVPKSVDRLDSLSFSMSMDLEQYDDKLSPLSESKITTENNKVNNTYSALGTY